MTITEHRPLDTGTAEPPTEPIGSAHHWTGADARGHWITAARDLAPQLAQYAPQHDRDGTFVHEGIELLRTHGFLPMLVPREAGGGGATIAEASGALAELAHGCPSTSLVYAMHSHVLAAQVWRHHRGLPAPVLAKVAQDDLLLVSTGAADWLGSSGSAIRVEGGYVVSGRKSPASGSPAGAIMATSARWESPDGPQVIHCSIPFATAGVTVEETWDAIGMRGTGSDTIVLDGVFVPDQAVALVRPADVWHPIWSVVLGVALPLIMSTYVGVAETAAAEALAAAAPRAGDPDIAPMVGRMLGRLAIARDTCRAMIDAADDLRFDNTLDHASLSLTRKSTVAEACIETVRLAQQVAGGAAFRRGGIERLYRDVQGALYHPLPAVRQERFTGRVALGLEPV
jgi:acyl-CoA dehydrogenase